MAEFVLKVQDIDERGKDYDFPLTGAWLDSALGRHTACAAIRRMATGASSSTRSATAARSWCAATSTADLLVECSRCLADTPLHVDTPVTALLEPGAVPTSRPEELELDEEDLDRAQFVGHEVVLDELVREHLLLECPMQPLCAPGLPGHPDPDRTCARRTKTFGEGRSTRGFATRATQSQAL